MAQVSIIIPVYNTEKYLRECLDSVVNQTFHDIEVICINDGSVDLSGAILDEYALVDPRIKVIHKENGGYGRAMNIGIDMATGEYIGIVEPDDYIESNTVEILYNTAKANELDIVSADYKKFYGDNEKRIFQIQQIISNPLLYNVVINPSHCKEVFRGKFINPAGLFKRSFLVQNDIKHNETPGASYQDVGFCFLTLVHAERVMLIHDQLYCYRQDNPNSSIASKEKPNCVLEEYNYIWSVIAAKSEKLEAFIPEYLRRRFSSCMYTYSRIAHQYKLEFLKKFSADFNAYKEKGILNLDSFYDKEKETLLAIMTDPIKFNEKADSLSKELHEALCDYKMAVIYGVGVIGKRILDTLYEDDREKILGFAVTDITANISDYKGFPVRCIDEYIPYKDHMAVIVGVTERYKQEIINISENKGFKNIITLNSILE
jgi:glycosyltransferase involved in cell wall biosynthesis